MRVNHRFESSFLFANQQGSPPFPPCFLPILAHFRLSFSPMPMVAVIFSLLVSALVAGADMWNEAAFEAMLVELTRRCEVAEAADLAPEARFACRVLLEEEEVVQQWPERTAALRKLGAVSQAVPDVARGVPFALVAAILNSFQLRQAVVVLDDNDQPSAANMKAAADAVWRQHPECSLRFLRASAVVPWADSDAGRKGSAAVIVPEGMASSALSTVHVLPKPCIIRLIDASRWPPST